MIARTIRSGALAAAFASFAWGDSGIKPRAGAAEYPSRAQRGGVAVGAAVVQPGQVRTAFSTDLNRGYVVVEVGVYPDRPMDLDAGDFVLRLAGTNTTVRPASAKTIASMLQKTAPSERDIAIYPQIGIGYETAPSTYDPVHGTSRRGGGLSTSAGVGAGVGSSRPASTDQDRKTMETELSDKALPERQTAKQR